jgi:hypothetical protein
MEKLPKEGAGDRVDAAVRAAAGAAVGALNSTLGLPPGPLEAAAAVVMSFLAVPLQARRDVWLQQLADAIEELRKRVGELEDGPRTDRVLDTVAAATTIAMRNASNEKRAALRNAIVNAGLPGGPSDARVRAFVRMVDDLDELHVRMLHLLADPVNHLVKLGRPVTPTSGYGMTLHCDLATAINTAFASDDDDLVRMVIEDVQRRKLAEVNAALMCYPGHGFLTPLGKAFVKFIGEPVSS